MWGRKRRLIFVSYAHQDKPWMEKLRVHLEPLSVQRGIELWVDRTDLKPGDDWPEEIQKALRAAKVAVVLLSPAFTGSPFIRDNELPLLLDQANRGKTRLIWVPIQKTFPEDRGGIDQFQCAIEGMQPLAELTQAEADQQIFEVATVIRQVALDKIPAMEPPQPLLPKPAIRKGAAIATLSSLFSWITYQILKGPTEEMDRGGWPKLLVLWAVLIGLGWYGGSALLGRVRRARKSLPLAAFALLLASTQAESQQAPATYFVANPPSVIAGQAVTLFWSVPPGFTAVIDGLGAVRGADSRTFVPQSGRYHLAIFDMQGRRLQDLYADVTVLPRPQGQAAPPPLPTAPQSTGPTGGGGPPRARTMASAMLVLNQAEQSDYGLYSYVLMRKSANQNIAIAVLEAVQKNLEPADRFTVNHQEINILLVPVKNYGLENADPGAIYSNYNYARAEPMIDQFVKGVSPGPYILTLDPQKGRTMFLLQDFSRTTPEMARSMLEHFREKSLLTLTAQNTKLSDLAEDMRAWLGFHDTLPSDRQPVIALIR